MAKCNICNFCTRAIKRGINTILNILQNYHILFVITIIALYVSKVPQWLYFDERKSQDSDPKIRPFSMSQFTMGSGYYDLRTKFSLLRIYLVRSIWRRVNPILGLLNQLFALNYPSSKLLTNFIPNTEKLRTQFFYILMATYYKFPSPPSFLSNI